MTRNRYKKDIVAEDVQSQIWKLNLSIHDKYKEDYPAFCKKVRSALQRTNASKTGTFSPPSPLGSVSEDKKNTSISDKTIRQSSMKKRKNCADSKPPSDHPTKKVHWSTHVDAVGKINTPFHLESSSGSHETSIGDEDKSKIANTEESVMTRSRSCEGDIESETFVAPHVDNADNTETTTKSKSTCNSQGDEIEQAKIIKMYDNGLESWLCTEVLSYPVIAIAFQYGQVFRQYGFHSVQSVVELDPDHVFTMPVFSVLNTYHKQRLWKAIIEHQEYQE